MAPVHRLREHGNLCGGFTQWLDRYEAGQVLSLIWKGEELVTPLDIDHVPMCRDRE